MKKLNAILFLCIPIALFFLLNEKWGNVPPIGKFLDPYSGFWENAEDRGIASLDVDKLKGIQNDIDIIYDKNKVPHIFAKNTYDVYYAQGYVTAKDRLWQMDFQTRFAAGRISEIVGDKALELDRYQRRMGMVYGAENSLKGMLSNPATKEMILAYTAGINAYIQSLNKRHYPIEYKILNYKPELWTPLKCALLLKQMSATLAMGTDDFLMTNILQKYGKAVTQNLFPDVAVGEDPIIPKGTEWDFKPLPIPQEPLEYLQKITGNISPKRHEEGIGSNNWALAGSKTATGYPLLANDPHLNLTLPSIWYQVQLNAPGLNVYGVSLPGSPGVVIGFNNHIAWGVTNVGADVLDFYQIKFDAQKENYLLDGKWVKVNKRIEKIKILGAKEVNDTVLYTHQGPVVYTQKSTYAGAKSIPIGHAVRWIAHDESNELLTLILLNKAKNYNDYRKAITYFSAPAQNFIFASTQNDIAITPNGKFPLKWKDQGKFILDGSKSSNDWQGWIPASENPTVKNPERGFVSSANQSSTDASYPYYINWEFAPWERGKRINERLAVMQHATVDSLRLLQLDDYSISAQYILDTLLNHLSPKDFKNNLEKQAYQSLKNWNKYYKANAVAPSIFEDWLQELNTAIWEDDFGDGQKNPMRYPNRNRTELLLLHEQKSPWFDNVNTPKKETFDDIVRDSYAQTLRNMVQKYGSNLQDSAWQWGHVKNTRIEHLAKIPGFASEFLNIGGAKNTINALNSGNGPSWRMVVSLKPPVQAYGVYPGGQSGNPGSFYYDNMIATWAAGQLNPLLFMQSLADSTQHTLVHLIIKKK